MSLRVITNSELSARKRCPREHHYAYELGYRSTETVDALAFGNRWHLGMEEWWLGHGLPVAIARSVAGCEDPYEVAKLRALLVGYDARWGGEDHDVVGVECEFRAPVVNPETGCASRTFVLGGKIDVLLDRKFVEHKTTSDEIGFGSVYWRVLTMNSQVSTYYAGAKSLGREVDGCIYDVVKKPTIRPLSIPVVDGDGVKIVVNAAGARVQTKDGKKWRQTGDSELGYTLQTRPETPDEFETRLADDIASNPDKYYQRGEVVRLESEERDAMLDVWQIARAMREDSLEGRHPRNADACRRYGRMCPYFEVCCGEASLDDSTRFVRVENVHQELSTERGSK